MWITSCKSQKSGWLVNGNMGVTNDPNSSQCADVLAWIAEGNTPEPADVTPADVQLRAERDQLLAETDTPWGLADYNHPDKQLWYDYRQALRDLTSTADPQLDADGNLTNVNWPTKPA